MRGLDEIDLRYNVTQSSDFLFGSISVIMQEWNRGVHINFCNARLKKSIFFQQRIIL